ncbi:hypothetical protein A33M_0980 [Rhodovulum sp. PH10]|nr:hypothetical protein A33M_0980 [Rhodovulum sp. PH10]
MGVRLPSRISVSRRPSSVLGAPAGARRGVVSAPRTIGISNDRRHLQVAPSSGGATDDRRHARAAPRTTGATYARRLRTMVRSDRRTRAAHGAAGLGSASENGRAGTASRTRAGAASRSREPLGTGPQGAPAMRPDPSSRREPRGPFSTVECGLARPDPREPSSRSQSECASCFVRPSTSFVISSRAFHAVVTIAHEHTRVDVHFA